MMREIGYSDRVFQLMASKTMYIHILLKEELELDALKKAAKRALADFPEFAVAPVKKNGRFYYIENNREIAFYPADSKARYFGTDETNNYLFYFRYDESSFVFTFFHGMTDFIGFWAFIRNIVYYYACELGIPVPDISTKKPKIDEEERFDPYKKYQSSGVEEAAPEIKGEVFHLKNRELPGGLHQYELSISNEKFLAVAHEWKTSASSVLAAVLSNAIAELYDIGDKEVAIKLTVDMRPFFTSQTRVNFSKSLMLSSSREDRSAPIAEQAIKFKSIMEKQMTAEYFSKQIAGVVAKTRAMSGEIDEPYATVKTNKRTCTLSYLGRMDFPEGYDGIIKEYHLKGYVDPDAIRFTAWAAGDRLHLKIDQTFDSNNLAHKVAEILEQLGLGSEIKDLGRYSIDCYDIGRIRDIGSATKKQANR